MQETHRISKVRVFLDVLVEELSMVSNGSIWIMAEFLSI